MTLGAATGHASGRALPADRRTPGRVAAAAALAWLLMAAGAVANGVLRQGVLSPWLGERVARVLSIAILVAIVLAVSFRFVRARWMGLSYPALFAIGASWAAGSALFELGLGRLVLGVPWSELLAAYDLLAGQYWILAPTAMILGPALARRLSRERSS